MAELGSIQQTDVNRGTRPIDRTAELRALDTALGVTKKIVTEGVKADVRTDVQGALEETLDEAAAGVLESTTEASFIPIDSEGLTGELQVVANTIRKHQAQAAQATSGNFRTRAILNIQLAANEAKIKYPWFSDEIDSLAGRFVANSPDITKLGLVDSALNDPNNISNKSQDYLDELSQYAYGRGDNQLNIPATVELHTPEFIQLYARRNDNLQKRISLANKYKTLQAEDALNARNVQEIVTEGLVGASSTITTMFDTVSRTMDKLHRMRIAVATGSGDFSAGSLAAAEDFFARVTVPKTKRELARIKQLTIQNFQLAWPANTTDSPEFTAASSVLDDVVEQLDTIVESLDANSTDVKTMLDNFYYINGTLQLERSPNMLNFVTFTKAAGSDFIRLMESGDFTFASAHTQQLISDGFRKEVEALFPRILFESSEVEGLGEATEQREKRARNRNTSASPGGIIPTRDAVKQATQAMSRIQDTLMFFDQHPAQLKSPVAVKGFLIDMTAGLEILPTVIERGKLPEDEQRALKNTLSSSTLITMVDKIGRDTPEVQAFNLSLQEDYLSNINVQDKWIKSIVAELTSEVRPGVRWIDIMLIEDSGIEADGTITFGLDPVLFQIEVINKTTVSRQEKVKREAVETATRLSKEVSQYLQIIGLQDYLDNQGLKKPRYGMGLVNPDSRLSLEQVLSLSDLDEDGRSR